MAEVLDGFLFGVVMGALVLSIALNIFLYFGIPSLVMGIIEQYLPGKTPRSRTAGSGIGGIMDNPIVSTMVGVLRSNPGAPQAPVETQTRGMLGRMLRR